MEKTKLNLYESIKKLDKGVGADALECQELMGCSDTDFEEYVDFAKKTGQIFMIGGKMKLL